MSSIRTRLSVGTLLAVTIFLAINGVAIYWVVRSRLVEERDRNLVVLARSTGAALRNELRRGPEEQGRVAPRYALEGVAFSPWTDQQDPNRGAQLRTQELWDRLQLVRDDSSMVRTYGVDGGLQDAGWLLHLLGKEAVIGAWIGSDAESNERQLDTLVRLCRAGDVDVAVIGSEVLLRGDLTGAELVDLITRARAAIPQEIPITTADTWRSFLETPELLTVIDLVYVNYYPYWEGISIDEALPALAAWHDRMLDYALGKPVIVSEAGWPSAGGSVGDAHSSPENAERFFLEFVSWARMNDVRYTYFCALDEPWKAAYEGSQGAHWGYRDAQGQLKPGMRDVFDGLVLPQPDPSVAIDSVPQAGSQDDLSGLVQGVGTLTHRVAPLIQVNGVWYSKPSFVAKMVPIASDGRWVADVTTGAGDEQATAYAAFLLPADYDPPSVDSLPEIPQAFYAHAIAHEVVER